MEAVVALEDRDEAQVPGLRLMPGESLVCKDEEVTLLDPFAPPCNGCLAITTAKLAFLTQGSVRVLVPLGLVDRIEKVGGHSSRGEHAYGLEVVLKDFRSLKFSHRREDHSRRAVFEALTTYAFPLSSDLKYFALQFKSFKLELPAGSSNGWQVYNYEKEMARQGVPNSAWRITKVNAKYDLCPTYPALMAVPATVTDENLTRISQFRSRGRLPALSWMHPTRTSTITRCSQPRVGVAGKRCAEDESMIAAIREQNSTDSSRLYVMDARPRRNAVANQAKGLGYEYSSVYSECEICFLNIHNIHVMRESLKRLRDICFPVGDDAGWLSSLESTNWLKHAKAILSGAVRIVELVDKGSSVLIHCSDGWDRTAQLSSLAMIMLDPYYRTIEGFEVLIEKEWLSFGHKFSQRLGLGDKNFGDEQRSPVFLQFIDCVWQVTQQYPCAFEFNEKLLISILDHMHSGLFGTFLFNCERERVRSNLMGTTHSLWDFITSQVESMRNPLYAPDMHKTPLKVESGIRFMSLWKGYYFRWNPHMLPQESIMDRANQLKLICDKLQADLEAKLGSQEQQPVA